MALRMAADHEAETLGIREAAARIGRHHSTLRRAIQVGKLPAHKVPAVSGPQWRIAADDLEAYAQGNGVAYAEHSAFTQPGAETLTRLIEDLAQLMQTVRALPPSPGEVQAQVEDRKRLREIHAQMSRLGELQRLRDQLVQRQHEAESQAQEILRLQQDLRRERAKPWWRRLFG